MSEAQLDMQSEEITLYKIAQIINQTEHYMTAWRDVIPEMRRLDVSRFEQLQQVLLPKQPIYVAIVGCHSEKQGRWLDILLKTWGGSCPFLSKARFTFPICIHFYQDKAENDMQQRVVYRDLSERYFTIHSELAQTCLLENQETNPIIWCELALKSHLGLNYPFSFLIVPHSHQIMDDSQYPEVTQYLNKAHLVFWGQDRKMPLKAQEAIFLAQKTTMWTAHCHTVVKCHDLLACPTEDLSTTYCMQVKSEEAETPPVLQRYCVLSQFQEKHLLWCQPVLHFRLSHLMPSEVQSLCHKWIQCTQHVQLALWQDLQQSIMQVITFQKKDGSSIRGLLLSLSHIQRTILSLLHKKWDESQQQYKQNQTCLNLLSRELKANQDVLQEQGERQYHRAQIESQFFLNQRMQAVQDLFINPLEKFIRFVEKKPFFEKEKEALYANMTHLFLPKSLSESYNVLIVQFEQAWHRLKEEIRLQFKQDQMTFFSKDVNILTEISKKIDQIELNLPHRCLFTQISLPIMEAEDSLQWSEKINVLKEKMLYFQKVQSKTEEELFSLQHRIEWLEQQLKNVSAQLEMLKRSLPKSEKMPAIYQLDQSHLCVKEIYFEKEKQRLDKNQVEHMQEIAHVKMKIQWLTELKSVQNSTAQEYQNQLIILTQKRKKYQDYFIKLKQKQCIEASIKLKKQVLTQIEENCTYLKNIFLEQINIIYNQYDEALEQAMKRTYESMHMTLEKQFVQQQTQHESICETVLTMQENIMTNYMPKIEALLQETMRLLPN